ncbi:MAG: metalloregulator ArsR/SmtB family transcription factor, partial [Albidovulum sp.]|nr:metalloregulator ArsR/SmtB family transcription factor [Albidovulum sp.]
MEADSHPGMSNERAALMFSALGSEQRLAVLGALVRAGANGVTIGELGKRCGIEGSTLTHHLKALTQAGLVSQEKRGRSIHCAAAEYGM